MCANGRVVAVVRAAVLVLILASGLALGGCGGGGENGSEPAGGQSPAGGPSDGATATTGPTGVAGWIVWVDGPPDRLMAYNMSTGEQLELKTGDGAKVHPQIFVDFVVWQDRRADDGDIYGYSLSTDTESPLAVAGGEQSWPAVSDGGVVWMVRGDGAKYRLAYQSFEATEPDLVGEAADPVLTALSGITLVYADWRKAPGSGDIYALDVRRGKERAVCRAEGDQTSPSVDGDWVVWEDSVLPDGGNIYAFNLKSGDQTTVCDADGPQIVPDVWGDWVVWQDGRDDEGDIHAFNLQTGEERAICTAENAQTNPAICGTWVVWEDLRGATTDIYAYDLVTGTEYSVCADDGQQLQPALWVE
jgi:beta propeller repeat protein